MAILALEKESRRRTPHSIGKRIDDGQRFLLSRMCLEGGWNHGSVRALGYESRPYPETTGMGLAAMRGVTSPKLDRALDVAKSFLTECRSADALNLAAAGLDGARATAGRVLSSQRVAYRTIPETSLDLLVNGNGERARPDLGLRNASRNSQGGNGWRSSAGPRSLTGCAKDVPVVPSTVSIVRARAYDQGIYDTVRRLLAEHRLNVRGRSVLLKPNLVEFEPESSINTNPLLVHAAFEAFRAMGAASVLIAEGPGHRRNTLDLADAAGYFKIVPGFEDLFVDLNLDDVTRIRPNRQFSRLEKLYLPHTALGADLLVSMAKMKTHHWTGATLSMKNLFGTVPSGIYGWPKNVLHWAGIEECIADLHAAFPRQFAIVDGVVGMEGNGPIQGTPKRAGVLVAGRDPVSVDATCCRIMQIDPYKIGYLRLGLGRGAIAHDRGKTSARSGESIAAVATPFELPPDLPGLRLEKS